MDEARPGTSLYKIIAFSAAGLIVLLAVALFLMYGPGLGGQTATARLTAALEQRFPDSDPIVSRPSPDRMRLSLAVRFDPTVDAEQAHGAFQRVSGLVEAEKFKGVREIEVELRGTSLEGSATAASRTFEYEAGE